MRKAPLLVLLGAVLSTLGCASKRIVSAAPPSVSTPPPVEAPPAPPSPTIPPPMEPPVEPQPATPEPIPAPVPPKPPAPPRPRPAQPETAEPTPPKPEPPQISPQLSARDLANAKKNTTSSITTAERNLHQADGKQLNAGQKDLTEKISGFLAQAHEAIMADDWVRALNLAEKARVLSVELVKSF